MPRLRVIILSQTPEDLNTYTAALWADVPTARQPFYANANATSAWTGAQAADITALQNGSVVESVIHQRMPTGATALSLQMALQTAWQSYQTLITNTNSWSRYGSTWDGTTWTLVTVA